MPPAGWWARGRGPRLAVGLEWVVPVGEHLLLCYFLYWAGVCFLDLCYVHLCPVPGPFPAASTIVLQVRVRSVTGRRVVALVYIQAVLATVVGVLLERGTRVRTRPFVWALLLLARRLVHDQTGIGLHGTLTMFIERGALPIGGHLVRFGFIRLGAVAVLAV